MDTTFVFGEDVPPEVHEVASEGEVVWLKNNDILFGKSGCFCYMGSWVLEVFPESFGEDNIKL